MVQNSHHHHHHPAHCTLLCHLGIMKAMGVCLVVVVVVLLLFSIIFPNIDAVILKFTISNETWLDASTKPEACLADISAWIYAYFEPQKDRTDYLK